MLELQAIGNLGKDVAVVTYKDKQFLSFSIGTKQVRKGNKGERIESTTWVDCSMSYSEVFVKYLKKGTKVFVRGSMKIDTWTKDGTPSYNIRLNVDRIELLSSKD